MNEFDLIVMLTWHDVTVENSKEIFTQAKDAPAKCWGFKDVGLPKDKMKDLVKYMKDCGKTTFMESLAHNVEEAKVGIDTAIECGFDILLGTHYYPETEKVVAEAGLKHFPFIAKRWGGFTHGTIEEITAEAKEVCKTTVSGINLPCYRYADGNPEELFTAVKAAMNKPLGVAGSVATFEQMDFLKNAGARFFTIGGAFFEHKFGDSFADQITTVIDYISR